ncbi:hypothetical protein BMETH_1475_0 [methanotrophic bacterial endosymbiont of Bathymodiolus sp.]|nr:hypothetical protein BMETH_1475_0 [methanotrophic bacterial endosymbiont of Bathymodiolus sp.]
MSPPTTWTWKCVTRSVLPCRTIRAQLLSSRMTGICYVRLPTNCI